MAEGEVFRLRPVSAWEKKVVEILTAQTPSTTRSFQARFSEGVTLLIVSPMARMTVSASLSSLMSWSRGICCFGSASVSKSLISFQSCSMSFSSRPKQRFRVASLSVCQSMKGQRRGWLSYVRQHYHAILCKVNVCLKRVCANLYSAFECRHCVFWELRLVPSMSDRLGNAPPMLVLYRFHPRYWITISNGRAL